MIAELADLKVTRNIITLRQIVLDKLRDAIISSQLKPCLLYTSPSPRD